ncbi:hypothetical protein HAZT_HAZT011580 [Hyalella azteca]|uniref:Amino acid permease/ SLC12A domain-containing protein n=1 Tax=Hyalella azteca TaxID=294128 RepID=A0A6A0GZW6_HYAAZ|nr:hypothetical protein HAZT_HAZT011580 [Hyalella azteca]
MRPGNHNNNNNNDFFRRKVLTTLDLTSLGVGSCVGTGMYLVAGMVANTIAGPSVILSFIIAAIASIFSGVCYAEFGVRVPNTSGGAYMYSYVTVGEFMAFVIGWNMILEELIGTAACACALSACCNVMLGGGINDAMQSIFGTVFGRPPDVLAFLLTLFMGAVLIAGVRKSVAFNNVLNSVNFCVWVFMMSAGLFYADTSNWTEHGGFMPHGVSGVLTGAATCFYGFIGFDIIATTGEEAINPVKSIPRAIVMSLFIILMAYVSSSALITLMVSEKVFNQIVIKVQAHNEKGVLVLLTSLYAGTLLAYTLVSTCVLILRYQPHSSTLVELLPESIRTPMAGTPVVGSPTGGSPTRRKVRKY